MNMPTVLIVDDEPDILELLDITLTRMNLQTLCAGTLSEALEMLSQHAPDLCLTDMKLPDGNGIDLVEHIQKHMPNTPVAMITAYGNIETAIAALKAGAFDFINKPVELDTLRNMVSTALKIIEHPAESYTSTIQLIGNTELIQQLRSDVIKLSRSQAPVYISGESGSGKEVVAHLIHSNGPRSNGPFIPVNCGAIPEELMESELFGHLKGSFTGAIGDKVGLFEAARGGTLFLDEVADLPLAMQVKLLRAIQEKSIRRVGSAEELNTDIRILCATHKNLSEEVDAGRFRSDLFYRLNVIEINVPSLRQRRQDIGVLSEFILKRLAGEMGSAPPSLSSEAAELLQNYSFPGNVRQLENILERALTLSDGKHINAEAIHLPAPQTDLDAGNNTDTKHYLQAQGRLESFMEDIERDILSQALEACRWNKTATAEHLGISFRSLRYRLKKLNLNQ